MSYKGFGEVLLYQRFVPENNPDLRIGVFFWSEFYLAKDDEACGIVASDLSTGAVSHPRYIASGFSL